jgi:hypothetical protein
MVVLQEVVENRGGQVIDGEYREPHSKFAFQCSKGHQWITTYDRMRSYSLMTKENTGR